MTLSLRERKRLILICFRKKDWRLRRSLPIIGQMKKRLIQMKTAWMMHKT
ncbi:putative C protein [Maraba virus]|uniref:Putative C protein n=1 Tax=Maraba virus TaxID=1046251 RepID=F8SPF2_9RHAB|nr:putative C protein [Maraba virus]AEI52258.1 putative C protein [Maraba virus]